jgi:peptide/nickel transport system substrate-binding protein
MSNDSEYSRRRFVKGTAAAATVGAFAGCTGDDGGGGGSSDENLGPEVESFEFMINTANYDAVRHEAGQLIADTWRELGFQVELDVVDINTIIDQALVGQDFDTYILNWTGRPDRIDPDHFTYGIFHSSQTDEGSYNFVNYENEEYDEYAEAQRRALDQDERKDAVDRCQEIAMSDQPHTPIANRQLLHPYNADRFENLNLMMGDGLNAFWNLIDIEPTGSNGTLRFGMPSDINNFNPLSVGGTPDEWAYRLVYDRLARIGGDGTAQPWAAEEWEAIDETTWEVTIRDGMTWHDGEDVTTDDVKFSFDYAGEHSPNFQTYIDPIEEVTVVDDTTVEFSLEEPFAPFLNNTLGQVFLIPEHIWSDVPDDVDAGSPTEWSNPDAIGSGPFQFEYWERQQELSLSAYDDHFNPPNIDEFLRVPGGDMTSLVRALEQGEIDMIGWNPQPNTIERLDNEVGNIEIASIASNGFYHVNYQLDRAPFGNRTVRRALAHAIPKQDIVETLLLGRANVAHSQIAEVNEFWHNPDVEEFNLDLEAARSELEEAGFGWDSNGNLHYPPQDNE